MEYTFYVIWVQLTREMPWKFHKPYSRRATTSRSASVTVPLKNQIKFLQFTYWIEYFFKPPTLKICALRLFMVDKYLIWKLPSVPWTNNLKQLRSSTSILYAPLKIGISLRKTANLVKLFALVSKPRSKCNHTFIFERVSWNSVSQDEFQTR